MLQYGTNADYQAARADVWEIYEAGRETLATTAWDEPTVSWVSSLLRRVEEARM